MSIAPRYYLVDDLLAHRPSTAAERAQAYDLSYSPYCVVAVFRLALPASASRAKLSVDLQGRSASASEDPADGVRLRDKPLIITDDLLSATVQTSKGSYQHRLQFSLCKSPINYLSAILPGDWVMCWMATSRERGRSVVDRLQRLEPCNGFRDGLKFVGRVEDVTRNRSSGPTGLNMVTYGVSATGFNELSAQIFYDPFLAESTPLMGSWLARIGGAISDLLSNDFDRGGRFGALDINKLLPFFINLLLGDGIDRRFVNPAGEPQLRIGTGLESSDSGEAPYSYTVPAEVGKVLGKSARSRKTAILSYSDLLESLMGVQKYSGSAGAEASPSAPWSVFQPDGVEFESQLNQALSLEVPQRKKTGTPMLGEFMPTIPDFTNKSVWVVLRQWLNPTINEMYTVLRANEAGSVVPSLVVRQIPLSSLGMVDKMRSENNTTLTGLLELPRWVGHPAIVRSDSLSRTNALRFNFVHIYGQSIDSQRATNYTSQLIRSPPVRNDLDIQRSGLSMYAATVNCSIDEARLGAKTWMAVASDWLLDQHLVLGGTVDMELVEAPIVHGDAFEYDEVVSMIEGVTHHFEASGGSTRATTRLQLTHGVRSDDDPLYRSLRDDSDSYIFIGIREEDCVAHDPGVSTETERPAVRYELTPQK